MNSTLKKTLIWISALCLLLCVVFLGFRSQITFALLKASLQPGQTFAEDTRHTSPNYQEPASWAALPAREDAADVSPLGSSPDNQATADVDVFFVHPTTYFKADHWNQPLDHAETNKLTDDWVIPNQASVFNNCCKVYAPRYRQATLYSFLDYEGVDPNKAIDFAYSDVRAAFHFFLENYNHGRPFIIAGHSQGSKHVDTLLKDVINGTPLMDRMVAAYPIGYPLDGSNGIPVCATPDQLGCQVTWNSVGPGIYKFRNTHQDICVNPLNWRNDNSYSQASANSGSVNFLPKSDLPKGTIEKGNTDAQCVDGQLLITELNSDNYPPGALGPDNFHIYDYQFFYMNIRENVAHRINAFWNRQQDQKLTLPAKVSNSGEPLLELIDP